jgi:hypothetical protein
VQLHASMNQDQLPMGWWLQQNPHQVNSIVYSACKKSKLLGEILAKTTYPSDVRMFANSPTELN